MEFSTKFAMFDHVYADEDTKTVFTITGFTFRTTHDPVCELSYFHNGEAKTALIEETRLKKEQP